MPSAAANRMELFVRKSFLKSMRTREKNDSYEHRLRSSIDDLRLKHETRTNNLNNEIRQLAVNLRKSGVKDVTASVSLPSTAPSSRSSTPDAAGRSTTTSLPVTLTSLPVLPGYGHRHNSASSTSYQKRSSADINANNNARLSRSTAYTSKFSVKSAPTLTTTTPSPVRRKSPKRSASSRVSFASNHHRCTVNHSAKGECQHFPCLIPSSYTHVGYKSDDESDEVTTHAVAMSASAQRRMFRALDAKSTRRPLRSNLQNKSKLREDGLNKLVHHMRWKNELTKPPEWHLNYGKPTPLRKVLKPARATALEVS